MYPSGVWRGVWEQTPYGRQPMEAFELHFRDGGVRGHGLDVIGPFTFSGKYDQGTGHVRMVKKYIGRHEVLYDGQPDGEGNITGKWTVTVTFAGRDYLTTGPFLLTPDLPRPTGDEPIYEIRK
jgi:hypothetical protein